MSWNVLEFWHCPEMSWNILDFIVFLEIVLNCPEILLFTYFSNFAEENIWFLEIHCFLCFLLLLLLLLFFYADQGGWYFSSLRVWRPCLWPQSLKLGSLVRVYRFFRKKLGRGGGGSPIRVYGPRLLPQSTPGFSI